MFCYLILLFFFIRSNHANTATMPIPKFEAFLPSGIRVSLPDTKGITEFFFWGNINVPMEGKDLGNIQLATYESTDGVWLIEDMDVQINAGDTIYYTFFVNINGIVERYERQQYTVKEIVIRPTTTSRPVATTDTTTPKPTTTPIPTTSTEKHVTSACLNDDVYIQLYADKTVVIRKDRDGNELEQIRNEHCKKSLVIDFSNGQIEFM